MVTSAWYVAIRRPGGSDQRRIDIHRVTKDWNSKTVTWDNKPSYDPKVPIISLFRFWTDKTGL